jgi:hypothetical protein
VAIKIRKHKGCTKKITNEYSGLPRRFARNDVDNKINRKHKYIKKAAQIHERLQKKVKTFN